MRQVPFLTEENNHDGCRDNPNTDTEEGETCRETVEAIVLKVDLRKGGEECYSLLVQARWTRQKECTNRKVAQN